MLVSANETAGSSDAASPAAVSVRAAHRDTPFSDDHDLPQQLMVPHVGERTCPRLRRSTRGNVHDSLGEGLRRLLRQVVSDAARDVPVLVSPGEFLGVRRGVRVRRTVGVAFHRNGRDADDRALGKPLFEVGVLRLALGQAQPPTVVVNHDCDMIGVVERRGGAIKRGIIEIPLRRSELPDELREVVPVFVVADPAAFGGEIILYHH